MAGSWERERRLDYIDFRMLTVGHVRRTDLVRTFGISLPQASIDLNGFLICYPDSFTYDKSGKRYAARKGYKTCRGLTPRVVAALRELQKTKHNLGWE